MNVAVEQEEDGRWIAEIEVVPGALAYGATSAEAVARVEALVLRVLADRLENGEPAPELGTFFEAAGRRGPVLRRGAFLPRSFGSAGSRSDGRDHIGL